MVMPNIFCRLPELYYIGFIPEALLLWNYVIWRIYKREMAQLFKELEHDKNDVYDIFSFVSSQIEKYTLMISSLKWIKISTPKVEF